MQEERHPTQAMNREGKREEGAKGEGEARKAYGLRLADDVGDGRGGFAEDGRGVHPLQVDVRRHVQARHPRRLRPSLRLPLPPPGWVLCSLLLPSSVRPAAFIRLCSAASANDWWKESPPDWAKIGGLGPLGSRVFSAPWA